MQPHSMCAVALANFMWNRYSPTGLKSAIMNVEYYSTSGKYKLNKYDLNYIEESSDRKTLKVYVMRSGGGIACQITLTRPTVEEGAEITMQHSQIHISGLREIYKLYKNKIVQGRHRNSERYRNFAGQSYHPDRKTFRLYSEIKNKETGYFVPIQYDLTMVSAYYD